eukprot:TRINITY_DN2135_c0_g1_i2.p1 TRINITY_DN2135_c0_g1~~TRINITY_DN2135_c0_g1_i2.p1  ORF type:complete len:150 (-),score=32.20 TRINITY_DN2135_c0_g1_i2:784-1233(-)
MPLLMCSELGKNPDGRKTKRQSELTDLEILSVELRSNNPTLWKKRAELRDAWNNYETQKGLYAGCLAAPVFVAGSFLRQAAFGTPVAVVHTAVSLAALVGGVGVFASTVLLDVGLKEAHYHAFIAFGQTSSALQAFSTTTIVAQRTEVA